MPVLPCVFAVPGGGAGPCGLRAAVELAMLGARVVLVEKRTKSSSASTCSISGPSPSTTFGTRAPRSSYGRFCTGSWTTS